jgi:soluble lytic murein transglycosylase-like protein
MMRRHTDRTRLQRAGLGAALMLAAIACLVAIALWFPEAKAADRAVRAADVPPLWRVQIEHDAARYFGLQAQPARMAAQLHQESAWRVRAQSPFAQGLAQFTPATAKWLPEICPEVGEPDVWSPRWSISAQSCYMAWLYKRARPIRATPMNDCDRWAFALRAYNGGEGWLRREREAAARGGANPNAWRAVQGYRSRAAWAHKENTEYPQRILLRIEPAYLAAGWTGGPACR